jgi:RHS repeat-associated protein
MIRRPSTAHRLRVCLTGWIITLGCLAPAIVYAQPPTESVEYYALDAIGSVRVVFDANGAILGRMDYGPFGQELSGGTGLSSRGFAGLFRDGEAGLDHAEARSYQSRTGRFSTTDQIVDGLFDPQGWNRYAYALNNPETLTDASGMQAESGLPPSCPPDGCAVTVQVIGQSQWVPMSPMLAFFLGWSTPRGSGGATSDGSGGEGGGRGKPTDKPLSKGNEKALENALEDLKKDTDCLNKVGSELDNFNSSEFTAYLNKGANFFDGTRSTTAASSLRNPRAAQSFASENRDITTISSWFRVRPGVNAVTSVVASMLTVYVRPNTIDRSHRGINPRNRSLLFHEGLHGFGAGNRYDDDSLMDSFHLSGSSSEISKRIAKTCK